MTIAQSLQAGLGRLGGALFPVDPSLDPQTAAALQRNALIQLGLGTLGGAQQSGASFGGSLFGGFQQAQQSLDGAQRQAFQSRQIKNQEDREDRLETQQNARIKLEQDAAAAKAREQKATVAQRVSSGIGNAKGRELGYLNVIRATPEFQGLAKEFGFDPNEITTDEQVLELGVQLGAMGGLGAEAPKAPGLELKAVVGPDGKPKLVTEQEALGQQPFYQAPASTNVNINNPSGEERKGATLAVRLEGGLQALQKIGESDPGALTPSLQEKAVGSVSEMGANALRSPLRQQAAAAQLDTLDAALTLSTGAAYTREQIEGLRNSYFPQVGDDPATVASKQERFEALVNSAYIAAGRAAPLVGEALKPRAGGQISPKLVPNPDGSFTYTP